ncbi:hypothetical protein VTL71DRAFT_1437 [Oculimacula yallundae]|uniref:PARP catalytic domain-containing protein n=1 Tax=Oculimacula yallundae TaxID=86028 RepID=A0ABR4CD35_9HELO
MADSKVNIPEECTLQGVGDMNSKQIRTALSKAHIDFDPKALKTELVPLIVLSRLWLVGKDHDADPAMLYKVTAWCGSLVPVLKLELAKAGIEKAANKWYDIENLIRAEYAEDPEEEDNEDDAREPDAEVTGSSSQVAKSTTKTPPATVMNFLITSFYGDVRKFPSDFAAAYPGCPVARGAVLQILNKISQIKSRQHLSETCTGAKSEADRLISWLSSSFGSTVIEADQASGLKIEGFPASVLQFVLAQPATRHDNLFTQHLKDDQNKSMVLFHGIDFENLQSLLRSGFTPAADRRYGPGLFMAATPFDSYPYAFKLALVTKPWSHTPFPNHGVLLGCQVTGAGRPVADGPGIHVINTLTSIAVRYIFLLPYADYANPDRVWLAATPTRNDIRKPMVTAFKAIRKIIDAAALGIKVNEEEEAIDEEADKEEEEADRVMMEAYRTSNE